MSSYQKKQKTLFDEIEKKFKQGLSPSTLVSPVDDYENDNQLCLTSVVFLPEDLQKDIYKNLVEPLKRLDANQYFFLPKSLHLTIQNIKTIHHPPLFNSDDIAKVKDAFNQIIPKYKSFSFELNGLFELPTSFSIRAYSDETLLHLTTELKQKLIEVGVPDNKQYASKDVVFGNITVCRYTKTPNQEFINKLNELKNVNFGQLEVTTVSLITSNVVLDPKFTKIIQEYNFSN